MSFDASAAAEEFKEFEKLFDQLSMGDEACPHTNALLLEAIVKFIGTDTRNAFVSHFRRVYECPEPEDLNE